MNNERKISPKEFSDKRKSQDDEILKKQLELREREIALKEKELECRLQAVENNKKAKKSWLSFFLEIMKWVGIMILLLVLMILYNIYTE